MNKKTLIALMVAFLISGCSDSAIDQVKEWRIEGASKYKIGQVFDNYEFCDSTEWSSSEGNSGNSIVSFDCSFHTDESVINSVKNSYDKKIKSISKDIEVRESELNKGVALLGGNLEESKKKLAEARANGDKGQKIRDLEYQVESDSRSLNVFKSREYRITENKEKLLQYDAAIKSLSEFENGRLHVEYNVVNQEVDLQDMKIYFSDNFIQLQRSDYSSLAKAHVSGIDMQVAWGKVLRKCINKIIEG